MTEDREHLISFNGNVASHPAHCWCFDPPDPGWSARVAAAAYRNRLIQREEQPEPEDEQPTRKDLE